ncbi:MAG: preprotein translocase subunit YajC [Candidatus Rokubacteria bacterium]|nr:preprotein translocase subunit YajC [Candidatus Rokubacteria bacterium]
MNVAHAAELAFAQSPGGSSGGGTGAIMTQIAFFGAIFAIFYFLLIRPQQKQRRERESMLTAVKKGDRIVTTGGLHGTVMNLSEQTVTLRVTDGVKLEFDRSAIGRIVEKTSGGDA